MVPIALNAAVLVIQPHLQLLIEFPVFACQHLLGILILFRAHATQTAFLPKRKRA